MAFRMVCTVLLPFFLLFVLASCSQIKEIAQDAYDASEEYPPAPRNLDASPDETGLLLVYAEMLEKGLLWDHDVDLDAVSIVRVEDPEKPIIVSDFSYRLVVFHDLDPGIYLINSLIGSKDEENDAGEKETIYIEKKISDLPDASVKIEAGAAVYVGKLTYMNDSYFRQKWVMSIDRAAEHELHAWEELHSKYKDSPWTPLIQAKIDQFQKSSR